MGDMEGTAGEWKIEGRKRRERTFVEAFAEAFTDVFTDVCREVWIGLRSCRDGCGCAALVAVFAYDGAERSVDDADTGCLFAKRLS